MSGMSRMSSVRKTSRAHRVSRVSRVSTVQELDVGLELDAHSLQEGKHHPKMAKRGKA
jgi:hypothetical protein